MKQILLIVCNLFFSLCILRAQENCEVKVKELQGTYTGGCEKGKANGNGKAIGTDIYEGEFKDGYPDGKGMYTWKDGHYYIGLFKKGKMEGKGDMYYESASGKDSVISGYWKKDKYYGEYEKQYIVIANTTRINKIDCSLTDKKGDNIFITVHQRNGSSSPAYVTNVSSISGFYYSKNNQVQTNSSLTRVQQVAFPFHAIFYLSNGENAEIKFNEKGNYDVYIDMQ